MKKSIVFQVLSLEERNKQWKKKPKNYLDNTEKYVVKFWALNSIGYICQKEVSYFTSSKGSHQEVEDRWRKDYPLSKSGENVLISIIYQ